MISTDSISRLTDTDVYDANGEKIGTASDIYLDDETGQPEWLTVRTGLFGSKQSFVPLRDAALTDDGVSVPVAKNTVKDAPRIDSDGHLSPGEEQQLYRHYGLEADKGAGTAVPRSTTSDDGITRSEERLVVGTRTDEVGRVRLRKYVVTEHVTETVPVSREEIRIHREPITDAGIDHTTSDHTTSDHATFDPTFREEEREVVLHAERPVVAKEAVPVERVRVDTETVTEERELSADLRKEEIRVEVPDSTGQRG